MGCGGWQPKKKATNSEPLSFNPFSNEHVTPIVIKKDDSVNFNKLVLLLKAYKKARCTQTKKEQKCWAFLGESYNYCNDCALADYEQGFCAIDELLEDIDKFRRDGNAIQEK